MGAICARARACKCAKGDCEAFYAWPKTVIPEPLWGCLTGHLADPCPSFCRFEWERTCLETHREALGAAIEAQTGPAALLAPEPRKRLEALCAAQGRCACSDAPCTRALGADAASFDERTWQCLERLRNADCPALCRGRERCVRGRQTDPATSARRTVQQLCRRSALCGCPSEGCEAHFSAIVSRYPDEEEGLRCAVSRLDCLGLCDSWGRGFPYHTQCGEPRLAPLLKRGGFHSRPYQSLLVRLLNHVGPPPNRRYHRPGVYLYAGWQKAKEERAKAPPAPDSPYVPTPQRVVDKMLEMAAIKPGDVLYDLGSGDGRIVVTAAKRYGIRAVGYELDPRLIDRSRRNAAKAGVSHLATFHREDIFTLDLSGASVVTLFLYAWLNEALKPQLARLKAGSRIVAFKHGVRGATPVQSWVYTTKPIRRVVFRYDVPWQEAPAP